jgi:hypothetical protein
MATSRHSGPPMTLRNMRSLGVREVYLDCECGRTASVVVDFLSDDVYVPEIRHRYRCSECGSRPRMSRPDWKNYRPPGTGVL